MIRLHLPRGDNPAVVSLQLPATPANIREAYAQLDTISTGCPTEIKDYEGYVLYRDCGLRRQAPGPSRNEKERISLTLQGPKGKHCVLLPGDEEYLDGICDCMGVESFAETTIQEVKFHIPYAVGLIPTELACVEDANELAFCIEGMQREDGELLKYLSVLSVLQPETMRETLRLALDLGDYERVPDDVEEYGKTVLRRIGADDEIIDAIDGYMDFAALGETSTEADGIGEAEFGLVRQRSVPFLENVQGLQTGG